jgi:hypothetical protein
MQSEVVKKTKKEKKKRKRKRNWKAAVRDIEEFPTSD